MGVENDDPGPSCPDVRDSLLIIGRVSIFVFLTVAAADLRKSQGAQVS